MILRAFFALFLLGFALFDAHGQPAVTQRQARLLVLDAYGRVISGVKPENIRLKIGKERPEVSKLVVEDDEPAAIAILINDRIFPEVAAYVALRFLQKANPSHEYCVIASNGKAEVLADWQSDRSALTSTLKRIAASDERKDRSVLFDAVALGLEKLSESKLKKKALLIFGDGYDINSKTKLGTVKELLKGSDAVVNAITVTTTTDWRQKPRDQNLEKITEPTGGRVLTVELDSGMELVMPRREGGIYPPTPEIRQKPATLIRDPREYLDDVSAQLVSYFEMTYLIEFSFVSEPDDLDVEIDLKDTAGKKFRTITRFRSINRR